MFLNVKKGLSELAKYLTSRLLVEDAIWLSLFLREESSSIEDIRYTFVETNKIELSDEKIAWLLHNSPRRFKNLSRLWALTAWQIRKNASFYDKAQAALQLSRMPLPSDDLADLLSRSSVDKASSDVIDGLLNGRMDVFEKLGPYWFLKEWTNENNLEDVSLLRAMFVRNTEVKTTNQTDMKHTLQLLFKPLSGAAVDTENLKWSLKRFDRMVNFDSIFNSGALEPVSEGYWIPYQSIPELIEYFNNLEPFRLKEYEDSLKELWQKGYEKYIASKTGKASIVSTEQNTASCEDTPLNKGNEPVGDISFEETEPINEFINSRLKRDDQQRKIIYAPSSRRQLILAPPGSGKTEAVARKLGYLVSNAGGLKPRQILVLSFSRSAVKVLMDRIRDIIEENSELYEDLRHISVRTFDSWTFRILRLLGFSPHELLKNSCGQDSYIKNIRLLVQRMSNKEVQTRLLTDEDKLKNIKHIIVDECQDLSGPRANLVKELLTLLAPPSRNIGERNCGFTLLGDMNQAIYDWMMKDNPDSLTSSQLISFVRTAYKHELDEISLSTNYRSTEEITNLINYAETIIRGDSSDKVPRTRKIVQLAAETGGKFTVTDLGNFCEKPDLDSSFAILFRRNDEAMYIACKLQNEFECDKNVRFVIDAGGVQEDIVPPWIAFLLGRYKGADITKSHFLKLYEKYQRELEDLSCLPDALYIWKLLVRACYGETGDINTSVRMDDLRERLTWRDAIPDDEGVEDKQIIFTNIHRSKGQQFGSVVLVDSHLEDHIDEDRDEAKVVYVGLSRAQESIMVLANPESKELFSRSFHNQSRNTKYERLYRCDEEDNWLRMLEIGIPGDIDNASFVSLSFHGSEERVKYIQEFLFKEQRNLIGKEVVLSRRQLSEYPPRIIYDIYLVMDNKRLPLGFTTSQLTLDLWTLKKKHAKYPNEIHDLRISQITTIIGNEVNIKDVADPWSTSRLWLGINIHGIGRFRFPFKYSSH